MQSLVSSLNDIKKIELTKLDTQTMIVQHIKSGGCRTTYASSSPGDVARQLRKHSDVDIVIKF